MYVNIKLQSVSSCFDKTYILCSTSNFILSLGLDVLLDYHHNLYAKSCLLVALDSGLIQSLNWPLQNGKDFTKFVMYFLCDVGISGMGGG